MSRPSPRGFTLVEMLVVLGIIAVLIGLLMPAVMSAINAARRAAIATEIKSLHEGVEAYKLKHGDYPPNFRDYSVFIRHVRKCYPKINSAHLNTTVARVWGTGFNTTTNTPQLTDIPLLDEGESLVFWLYLVDNDPLYPFKALAGTPTTTPPASLSAMLIAPQSPERHFPFKEDRFVDEDGDLFPAYRAIHSKETCYIYIDSRAYQYFVADFTNAAFRAYADGNNADGFYTRPYWSEIRSTTVPLPTSPATPYTSHFKAMNPTSFQIICAGQDGLFGIDPPTPGAKFFPGGGGTGGGAGYTPDDRDNMTNFSEGRRLEDHIP